MVTTYQGYYQKTEEPIAIVVSRFNDTITNRLLEGALDALKRHGISDEKITVVWVPGAFEIPVAAERLARTNTYKAIICLGAIIRGSTAHFDYVAAPVASQISQLSLKFNLPVIFGVLTTETIEQALERSGIKHGNKGFESALSALEMIDLLNELPRQENHQSLKKAILC